MRERSIRCGRETEYEVSIPVTVREYYIKGSGQLCPRCFQELYSLPSSLEKTTTGSCVFPTIGSYGIRIIPNKL